MKCSCGSKGFTLVEISIVLIIVGVLSVALIRAYSLYYGQYQLMRTTESISKVEDALEDFLLLNGRLPCAAPRNVLRTDSAYGREEYCTTVTPNTARASGKRVGNVRIGLVPTRTLGISDKYAVDGWGRLLTYAVTEDQSSIATFTANGGGIDVLDESGASRLTALGNFAHYVVISSGPSGAGGYNASGATPYLPCNTGSKEGENCDDDGVFIESVWSEADNAEYFDDKISYSSVMVSPLTEDPESCFSPAEIADVTSNFHSATSRGPLGNFVEFYGENCPDRWNLASLSNYPSFKPISISTPQYSKERGGDGVTPGSGHLPKFHNKLVDGKGSFITFQRLPTTTNGADINSSVLCEKKKELGSKGSCISSTYVIERAGLESGITKSKRATAASFPDGLINNATGLEALYEGTPKCPDSWTVVGITADTDGSVDPWTRIYCGK